MPTALAIGGFCSIPVIVSVLGQRPNELKLLSFLVNTFYATALYVKRDYGQHHTDRSSFSIVIEETDEHAWMKHYFPYLSYSTKLIAQKNYSYASFFSFMSFLTPNEPSYFYLSTGFVIFTSAQLMVDAIIDFVSSE